MRLNDFDISDSKFIKADWINPSGYQSINNSLNGYKFKTNDGRILRCDFSSKRKVACLGEIFKIKDKTTKFYLQVFKQKTFEEIKKELLNVSGVTNVALSKGCSLHGDIDIIIIQNKKEYRIPYNY